MVVDVSQPLEYRSNTLRFGRRGYTADTWKGHDMNTDISQRSVEAAKPAASGYIILFDDKIALFNDRSRASASE